jgi:hypothetical protein
MRLPGFTAERGISMFRGERQGLGGVDAIHVSNGVVPAWFCINDYCACSQGFDCLFCVMSASACGGKYHRACDGTTCIYWRFAAPAGVVVVGGGRLPTAW